MKSTERSWSLRTLERLIELCSSVALSNQDTIMCEFILPSFDITLTDAICFSAAWKNMPGAWPCTSLDGHMACLPLLFEPYRWCFFW